MNLGIISTSKTVVPHFSIATLCTLVRSREGVATSMHCCEHHRRVQLLHPLQEKFWISSSTSTCHSTSCMECPNHLVPRPFRLLVRGLIYAGWHATRITVAAV